MNTLRNSLAVALLACLPLLAACRGHQDETGSKDAEPSSALGAVVKKATDEARRKLATQNISISDADVVVNGHAIGRAGGRTRAEITPQGDLLIDGKTQAITPAQRALLLQYRQQIIAVAGAGMDIGVQGADLGMKAAGEAIGSIFSGNSDQVEQRIKPRAEKLEAAARELCKLLPPLLSTQQELASTLPAFRPYANMTQEDIDDCMKDHGPADDARRAQIRDEIRSNIRSTIRSSVQAIRGDASGTAPAEDAQESDTTH